MPQRDRRISLSLSLLKDHALGQEVSIHALARSLHLSSSRLRHLFKQHTGVPPGKWLKQFRLQRAKQVLENSFLSVKEVVALVGMNDVSHFDRDFKNLYGKTPSQVRGKRIHTSGGRHSKIGQ